MLLGGFMPAGGVSNSSTLHIFWDESHSWWLLCQTSLSAQSFPLTAACTGLYMSHCTLWERTSNRVDFTWESGLPSPDVLHFCGKHHGSVRMVTCVSWLSPLTTTRGKECGTARLPPVSSRAYNIHQSDWMKICQWLLRNVNRVYFW